MPEEEALRVAAAEVAHGRELLRRLDALGADVEAVGRGHPRHRPDDDGVLAALGQVDDERAVELDA